MSVSDNFNRADGGLGSNWTTQQNAPQIVTNAAKGAAAGAYGSAYWSANSFNATQDAQGVWANGVNYVAPAVRCSGTGAGTNWYAYFTSNSVQKSVSGTITTVGSPGGSVASGDTMKLAVSGTSLSTFINGVQTPGSPLTDSSLASGNAGMAFFADTGTLDDWLATGEVVGGFIAKSNGPTLQAVKRASYF